MEQKIAEAARLIRAGGVVAFPTETVYGLGADATNSQAVDQIFTLKGRPPTNPLIVHVATISDVEKVAFVPDSTLFRALTEFWPGPLSIILPKKPVIPSNVTAGKETVAVRIPNHALALEFIKECQTPIAAPSANIFSSVSPTTAQHVVDSFGSNLELVLDGGPCEIGLESTVALFRNDYIEILRPGGITEEQLIQRLGRNQVRSSKITIQVHIQQLSPGLLEQHYSPQTPLKFVDQLNAADRLSRIGYISFGLPSPSPLFDFQHVTRLSKDGNKAEIAAQLFAALREMDSKHLDMIVVDRCEERGLGTAIMDRLQRATHSEFYKRGNKNATTEFRSIANTK